MAVDEGFSVLGLDYSPIQGGHGNIEFLAYLRKEDYAINQVGSEIEKIVEKAHREFKDE
ncbi:hemolysin [Streptococcus infantis SK1302]|uniref:Hemolysin n=1 Tax=Streptococcus infantis SK1302 TaxID=871237 RepID=A0ABN0B2K0_9STRE|nr:hemolysin [Streptococcus infantis SK1302]